MSAGTPLTRTCAGPLGSGPQLQTADYPRLSSLQVGAPPATSVQLLRINYGFSFEVTATARRSARDAGRWPSSGGSQRPHRTVRAAARSRHGSIHTHYVELALWLP